MNTVNENVIVKILNSCHADVADLKITQLKWTWKTKIVDDGKNFFSKVYRLIIEYQTNGTPRKTVLFVKAPCDCGMYEPGLKMGIYSKEVTMYTKILPQLYAFEDEYFTARNYYVDDKDSLFLEDLSQSGYQSADRVQQLDFQHCVLALKRLAKLHGLSVHLKTSSGLPKIVDKYPPHGSEEMQVGLEVGQSKFYSYLDASIRAKYAEKIEFFKKIDWARAMADLEAENSSFNVLNHGDYRVDNLMFKYDKYGIVKETKMVDLQTCFWGNPATDLIYFAITSIRYDVYSEYFHLLCTIYLNTLNGILANFGYPAYGMEELKKDIDARYAYGIALVICYLPICVCDPNDPIDVDGTVENNKFDGAAACKVYGQKNYTELATKWFLHFAQKDIPKFENK